MSTASGCTGLFIPSIEDFTYSLNISRCLHNIFDSPAFKRDPASSTGTELVFDNIDSSLTFVSAMSSLVITGCSEAILASSTSIFSVILSTTKVTGCSLRSFFPCCSMGALEVLIDMLDELCSSNCCSVRTCSAIPMVGLVHTPPSLTSTVVDDMVFSTHSLEAPVSLPVLLAVVDASASVSAFICAIIACNFSILARTAAVFLRLASVSTCRLLKMGSLPNSALARAHRSLLPNPSGSGPFALPAIVYRAVSK
mmetsp:Transcript_5548/g.9110  ORF Transcript_5548/g.9110 Transcript_5548/m.9110 type:complete len:254 (+) Transcript_5548:141-902(+)